MIQKMKDPVSSLTHLVGAMLALPVCIYLLYIAIRYGQAVHIVAYSVFGLSILLLYSASTIYHMLDISPKAQTILRRIDHMMIFVLIAGSYTPICLLTLRGPWGYTLLVVIWLIAISGITLKALWISSPRWVSSVMYILMGWLVVIAFYPLIKALSLNDFLWLLAGGIIYTLGGIIYAIKIPKLEFKYFGFHELFHLFVMGGTACHIVFMYRILMTSLQR